MPPALLNTDEIAAKFSASLVALSKLQGFSEKVVTLAECGVVLKTCAGRTKVAKPDAIDRGARFRVLRGLDLTKGTGPESVTINAGHRGPAGRVWWRTKNQKFQLAGQVSDDGQTFTPSKLRIGKKSDQRNWFDVREAVHDFGIGMRRALPAARASAGLARQSWVQIADDLGITLEDIPGGNTSPAAIAKARAAIASNGKTYRNGIGTEVYVENKSFVASLTNQLPYWPNLKLDTILLGVIAGRAQFYQQNVARGVFASHADTVRAYPWLTLLGAEA